jgi:hypothetical protein
MSDNIDIDENEKKKLGYEELKDRVSTWCGNLFRDGIYSYNQHQDCLKNVDIGSVSYYKKDDSESKNNDNEKDTERIYGYYKKGKEKINSDTSNPNVPIIEDDFQKMTLYHYKKNKFLLADKNGDVSIEIDSDIPDEKDWQLVSLGKKDESNVFALRSKYGMFLMGLDDGKVNATNTVLSTWCQWKMIKHNDNFAFYSVVHKKYLSPVGDELILSDGWTDNNLWIMKKKSYPTGKHLIKFDNSNLILRKDTLVNKMYNYYRKSIDNKYEREYYKNKLQQLDELRSSQLNYLLEIIDNNQNSLENKKSDITEVQDINTPENKRILENIDNTIYELNSYRNDIKRMFSNLKEKEIQELNRLMNLSEKNKKNNIKLFKKAEAEKDKFIKELINLNKKTETAVNNLVGSLDIKLETNNQLGLKLEQNQPPRTYDDLTEIINSNFGTVKTDLTTQRRFFYLGIGEIVLIILAILYMIKKISTKI